MSAETITRLAETIVYESLLYHIADSFGLPTGSVYLGVPDHLYVNERTEETNNIQQDKYPLIAIFPEEGRIHWTQNAPERQQASYTTTGTVQIWESKAYLEQDFIFNIETARKSHHRLYKQNMICFLEEYRHGMPILSDILPETSETIKLVTQGDFSEELHHAPYSLYFPVKVYYRIYRESLKYLFFYPIISGSIYIDGASGRVSNELLYDGTVSGY